MQISVTGRRINNFFCHRGFTLLELLVVLALIGMLFVVGASTFVGGAERKAMRQALAVSEFLKDVKRNTQLNGKIAKINVEKFGLIVMGTDRSWHHPEIIAIRLLNGDQRVRRSDAILFYPDGSSSGGLLELTLKSGTWRVNVDWWGRVYVEN